MLRHLVDDESNQADDEKHFHQKIVTIEPEVVNRWMRRKYFFLK
jgi:hypothetical protein